MSRPLDSRAIVHQKDFDFQILARELETSIPLNDQVSNSTTWYQQFEYDNLNRLEFMQEGGLRQEYVNDRYGNRTIHQTNTWGGSWTPS